MKTNWSAICVTFFFFLMKRESVIRVQILDKAISVWNWSNAYGKGIDQSVLLTEIIGSISLFCLCYTTSLEREKKWMQTSFTPIRKTESVLHTARCGELR